MQHSYISYQKSDRLIIIFSGWAMDANPLQHIYRDGYDIFAVWDYTGFNIDNVKTDSFILLLSVCSKYSEIAVFGWSFGVRIASDFIIFANGHLPITLTVAVNGTPMHIDNHFGIPEAIFNGTVAAMSDTILYKFRRRMFADKAGFDSFSDCLPKRGLDSLIDELKTFSLIPPADCSDVWTIAVISDSDFIIPTENQKNYWSVKKTDIINQIGGHYPDFQKLINTLMVDKNRVESRFSKARTSYHENASTQRIVAKELWQLTLDTASCRNRRFNRIVEVGAGSGILTETYLPDVACNDIQLWDITDTNRLFPPQCHWIKGDAETMIFSAESNSVDMVISASTLQWFNSPERFISETYRILSPGGIGVFALFVDGTFSSLKKLTGISLRYPSSSALIAALPDDASILLHKEQTITEIFDSGVNMMKHLRDTGVNGVSDASISSALSLARYCPEPDNGGCITLEYNTLFLIFQKSAIENTL